ncbi:MAG: ATP-binding protein, partial [Ruminococcus sp.]|nr:ATP-binding protein [Ruminococcus sp.]
RKYANSKEIPVEITDCLINELKFFQELSELTPEDFLSEIEYDGFMPKWKNSSVDIVGSYLERLKLVHRYGYGQYAEYRMFIFKDSKITPVKYPDTQRLDHLYGYQRERQAVIDNTLALLDGKPAQNVLLYGDAGTGKSSSVKAIVNEYADRGLRLIEITKEQLRDIPQIIDDISHNPLKFIIFIDDLTFTSGEDCFGSLKAMLEGSASARSDNIVIYATSNRRHLVKETFSEREGDDVHRNDTMQELISLSARFGLRVNFSRPDKKEFVRIAGELAKQKGLSFDEKDFELKAERFVMTSGNGRSPRTAKQFVNQLINEK